MDRETKVTFRVEEATIGDLHDAIRAGETTVVDVVKQYVARIRAFNGVASMLVTEDGAAVPQATSVSASTGIASRPTTDHFLLLPITHPLSGAPGLRPDVTFCTVGPRYLPNACRAARGTRTTTWMTTKRTISKTTRMRTSRSGMARHGPRPRL